MEQTYLLEALHITKTFPGVRALSDVSLQVRAGEVHALMGENGAGKSTLIKILTGIYTKDEGTILFDGRQIAPHTALEAQQLGISTIYQELNLSPFLSVAENIFLGRELRTKRGTIDWKRTNREAAQRMADLGITLDVTRPLSHYSTAIAQMISIARALVIQAKLLIMDEPTSSLDNREVNVLFATIKKLQKMGIAVIYISHRMSEIFSICDRVTVLKDGESRGTYGMDEMDMPRLLSLMIGRDAASVIGRTKVHDPQKEKAPVFCSVKNIRKGHVLQGIDLEIRKGEILGLAGLLGSGRTELAKIICGDDPLYAGEIFVEGKPVRFRSPKDAIARGITLCAEDRKNEGIFSFMDVCDNLTMAILPKLVRAGVINTKEQLALTQEYIGKLSIKTPSPRALIRNLSGGNQQKVVLARWLCMQPEMIILDEPTRGIDVGAKAEIEKLIQMLADSGIAVLFISSEIDELVRGCDRVAVLYEGRKVCELVGDEISREHILDAVARGSEEARALHQQAAQGGGGVA
nr:sugar ABC transporter ATP-binding protein [Maliibacterium massiliense]